MTKRVLCLFLCLLILPPVLTGCSDGSGWNNYPTVTSISEQFTDENTPAGPIAFTVDDADGDVLTVTATSSDTSVVTNGNIVLAGSGSDRTITLTPEADTYGTTTITINVSDSKDTVSITFELTVSPVDTITVTTRMTILPGMETAAIQELLDFVVTTRQEAGTVSYNALINLTDSSKLILYEVWRNWDAIFAHMASDHFVTFMARSPDLFEPIPGSDSVFEVYTCEALTDIDAMASPGTVITRMTARDTMEGEAISELLTLADQTVLEAGNIQYDAYQGLDQPLLFILDEVWESPAAVYAHFGTQHFADFSAIKDIVFKPAPGPNSPFDVKVATLFQ